MLHINHIRHIRHIYKSFNVGIHKILTRNITIKSSEFVLNESDANKILHDNKNIFEEEHDKTVNSNIKSFIPFHSLDIKNLKSSFYGKRGVNRLEPYIYYTYNASTKSSQPHVGVRTVIDWHKVSGNLDITNYPFGISETQVYAGFNYPRNHINSALQFNGNIDIKEINSGAITVEPHDMKIAYALELIKEQIYKLEKRRAKQFVIDNFSADHVKLENLDIHLDESIIKTVSYHIPAYIYKFYDEQNEATVYKILNGINGTLSGDKILSPKKTLYASGLLGSIVGIGSALMVPFLSIQILLLRTIGGFIIGGIPGWYWGKYSHSFKDKSFKTDSNNERIKNDEYFSTIEDERRNAGNYSNYKSNDQEEKEYDNTNNTNNTNNDSKYIILGLNPTNQKKYTHADIKKAYLEQVKKWHPDVYKGDKEISHSMTQRINEAYNELGKIHK